MLLEQPATSRPLGPIAVGRRLRFLALGRGLSSLWWFLSLLTHHKRLDLDFPDETLVRLLKRPDRREESPPRATELCLLPVVAPVEAGARRFSISQALRCLRRQQSIEVGGRIVKVGAMSHRFGKVLSPCAAEVVRRSEHLRLRKEFFAGMRFEVRRTPSGGA
ncbi:uncharacterized protein LACBIDRAFT_328029 [Laccaria bicolor S238N-H82]|uniref:Predicted protein n=1 Tax=Laccaria bicolor (strain S238N-H82 / ATCC MYA-4686) TaxID=486041 RepID=B0DE80_LACBS|nr:uncharacterized protein LACBIDRAFT_328029 [Laccaria bicolor S238N-H82]EDR07092.1 predicted protein [Laccaria bicolor S238N-H82]|eukprot:XP_001882023.1 predicted protein [Laccaria bicolor S238N-H82]